MVFGSFNLGEAVLGEANLGEVGSTTAPAPARVTSQYFEHGRRSPLAPGHVTQQHFEYLWRVATEPLVTHQYVEVAYIPPALPPLPVTLWTVFEA